MDLRNSRNLSLSLVSKITGIQRENISFYEEGKRIPSIKTLSLFCIIYDVKIQDFDTALNDSYFLAPFSKFEPFPKKNSPPPKVLIESITNESFKEVTSETLMKWCDELKGVADKLENRERSMCVSLIKMVLYNYEVGKYININEMDNFEEFKKGIGPELREILNRIHEKYDNDEPIVL